MGGTVEALTERRLRDDPEAEIIVDAIFGTGLTRAPEGDLAGLLRHLGTVAGGRLVAVDAPSGLCLDSGQMLGGGRPEPGASSVPLASLTVSFEVPKLGHFLADGPAVCGKLAMVDLGLATWRAILRDAVTGERAAPGQACVPRARLIDRVPLVTPAGQVPHRAPSFGKPSGHKYDHGHVLVVAGGQGRTGAARLAARAALRIGAGLVTLAAPPDAMPECAAQLTAIMLRRMDGATGLARLLEDPRLDTICLGPGLGPTQEARDLVKVALAAGRRTVLDADALTAFAGRPEELFDAIAGAAPDASGRGPSVVLTPHAGEFRRLFPNIARIWRSPDAAGGAGPAPVGSAEPGGTASDGPTVRGPRLSKVDAVRAAAERSGATVLLKGPDSVIGHPGGAIAINAAAYDRATPWLATAGAGDVLAGLIAGLAARSPDVSHAVEDAAWLHVEAARRFGPGLIAEDLPEAVPQVLREAGL